MAKLFGKNKLRDKANTVATEDILPFIAIVESWRVDYHTGTLRTDNETAREQAYNQDFFKTILGYSEKPTDPYTFQPKSSTSLGGIPDAIIGHFETAGDSKNHSAVVELKGANINLDRPQRRESNLSPVQQGFKYKAMHRSVPFVIVSNFWEFRLYNDNQLDYESWTLDQLVDPSEDYLAFKSWYVLVHKDNFTSAHGQSATERLLSDIRVEQEEVGKKFYKQYKEARSALIAEIQQFNPERRDDLDFLISKAQKIIDRMIFAAFAEDMGLLPDDTLRRLKREVQSSTFSRLWPTLIQFFNSIDKGDPRLEIPEGYNGGLFVWDEELNRLKLGESALGKVLDLSGYNFEEDLSVTILGHIFEQSITDIEALKASGATDRTDGSSSRSRRKKDGIFYTPDYIVRYIVENSLGVYLREHEEKFRSEAGLHEGIQDKTYANREHQAYLAYYDFLRNIKVVDPACGSGAFLVYVFDYLLAEHRRVGTILGTDRGVANFDQVYRSILRNNIYGVDLNEESVEIAKLSLWLKTAIKGKKLTALDQNLKVGNSLIDDPEVAGDKAFDWREQFREVFERGGFDVIIANPPWVSLGGKHGQHIDDKELRYLIDRFDGNTYMPNLFEYFVRNSTRLTKPGGMIGMIIPDRLGINAVYRNLRELLWKTTTVREIVYRWDFPGIITDTMTIILKYESTFEQNTSIKASPEAEAIALLQDEINPNSFEFKLFGSAPVKNLVQKIMNKSKPLGNFARTTSGFGGKSKLISPSRQTSSQREILKGASIGRYLRREGLFFDFADENLTGRTRDESKLGSIPKILIRKTGDRLIACYDESGAYPEQSLYFLYDFADEVLPHYLLGLLNSSLMTWLYRNALITNANSTPQLKNSDLNLLPIASERIDIERSINKRSETLTSLTRELYKSANRFDTLVSGTFNSPHSTLETKRWWFLNFAEFTEAMKVKLTLSQKDDLLPVFEKYKAELTELDTKIANLDREIDQLVYQLYDLTPEEIALVEASV